MKFVSKTLIATALLAQASLAWAAGDSSSENLDCSGRYNKNGFFSKTSWTSLDDAFGRCYALHEGTYYGKGRHSRHTYLLHVRRYYRRSNMFIALSVNTKTNHAALGILEGKGQGNYAWYGVKVSAAPNSTYQSIEVKLNQAPLFNFMIEPNRDGRVARIAAVNENPGVQVEAIDFDEVRAPLMRSKLPLGRLASEVASLSIMPAESSSELAKQGTPSGVWRSKLEMSAPTPLQSSFSIRSETLPGIFVLRKLEQQSYLPDTSGAISYIAVPMAWTSSFLGFESTSKGLYLFPVGQDGFLTSPPHQLELND